MDENTQESLRNKHQETLRRRIAEEHARRGTTQPPPDRVEVVASLRGTACVRVTGDGLEFARNLPMEDGEPSTFTVDELIGTAEHQYKWRREMKLSRTHSVESMDAITRPAGARVTTVTVSYLSHREPAVVTYHAKAIRTSDALRDEETDWRFDHNLEEGWWTHDKGPAAMARMRRNAARASTQQPMTVCALLAEWLRGQDDRSRASRLLFAANAGVRGTKVPWRALTNIEARNGRIIGTVGLGERARMRNGEIFLKGKTLPETVVAALAGRTVGDVVAHPVFGAHRLSGARNTREGLVLVAATPPVPYDELWSEIGE